MNELVENIEIGETVKFKAVILKKGEVHDLGNIYIILKNVKNYNVSELI